MPEVAAQLGRIVPPYPVRITAPLVVPPVTRSYALVGTAFDYALRFELQRRYPHVRTEAWVALSALAVLPNYSADEQVWSMARRIVAEAKAEHATYVSEKSPSPKAQTAMATHAIRLAKLDTVYRAGYVDANMEAVDPGDVQDVLRLLEVVPYETLAHPEILWLNPTFGRFSEVVGGADCDVISGDRLIDVKVTKNEAIRTDYLRQLVSYLMLARGAHGDDPAFPDVRSFGIYFARHGHLWTLPASTVLNHPDFAAVQAWYYERAAEAFGATLDSIAPHRKLPTRELTPDVPVPVKAPRKATPKNASLKAGSKKRRKGNEGL